MVATFFGNSLACLVVGIPITVCKDFYVTACVSMQGSNDTNPPLAIVYTV